MEKNKLDVIVPIALDLDWPTRDGIVADIIEQYNNYGITRFALASPSGGWRGVGYPPREHYIEKANLFAEIKNAVKAYGIECGWWITATVKSGKSDKFQSIVKEDGTSHGFASCPLDDDFRKVFSENVAIFAKIAKPEFIITEDDFSICAADGCFCEKHLEEFAKRTGRFYSREELVSIFKEKTQESYKILRQWRELLKDSLVGFAEAIRKELDKESPEIPVGYMQSGSADYDGDVTEAISRALAGDKHTPFSRLFGTFYCGVEVKKIPEELYHPLYTKQHTGDNFIFYHESDTYPHTRFYTAGKHMKAIMGAAYSYGFDGSVYQTQQLLDNPNEESVYGYMWSKERDRFNAVYDKAKMCELKGVELDYDPFWNTADRSFSTINPLWVMSVSRFGIPHTSLNSNVAFWDVRQAKYADDDTIMERLSKGLFLDGDAAKVLCDRGYGKYLGVEIGEDPVEGTSISYDLAAREVICDKFVPDSIGRNMTSAHMFAPPGNGRWLTITVTDEKCEVVTEAYTFQRKLITPAMTRFENELGGKVVVMGLTLDGNNSQALLNYRRQRLIQELLVWCSDEYAFVKENPDVFVITNESKKDVEKDFLGMITLISLCEDELDKLKLHLPPHLKKANDFCVLNQNGEWEKLSYTKTDDGIEINEKFEYCEPLYILAV